MPSLPKPVTKTGNTFLNRPFKELIAERKDDVAELRARARAENLEDRDDIALVRYLYSYGTVKHTLEALKAADRVAKEKADVLRMAEEGEPLPYAETVEKYQKVLKWKVSSDQCWYIIQVGHVQWRELLQNATPEMVVNHGLYVVRSMWKLVDETSRRLGCIRKYEIVLDFHDYDFKSWAAVPSSTYRHLMNEVSGMSEVLHPLSMGAATIIGLPGASIAKRIMKLTRPLLPKSFADARFCSGNRHKAPISQCPFVTQLTGGASVVPEFLGGSCPATGACPTKAAGATASCDISEKEIEAALANAAEPDEDKEQNLQADLANSIEAKTG